VYRATALEPATSGITGQYGATGSGRLRTLNYRLERRFPHFASRLQPAAAPQDLYGTRVVGMVPNSLTALSAASMT